jgi:F-type H+-transporting ATPase subunit delta
MMMHSVSRAALAALRERLDEVAGRFSTSAGLVGLADDVYAVAGLLATQPRLRRTLSDSTTAPDGRAELAGRLFDGQLSAASSLQLVRDAVGMHWSLPWDLVDALDAVADDALLIAAEQDGALDDVEDELFRFERVLDGEPRLPTIFDEDSVPAERRVALLRNLIEAKVSPVTFALLAHAVTSGHRHGIDRAIDNLLDLAAARRDRSVARVISAVELTAAQYTRLGEVLGQLYGRPISVRVAVEPEVQGGLVIRVGDEVIDGSVAAQLSAARSALAN